MEQDRVTEIVDVTPLPHNGCRPPKREEYKNNLDRFVFFCDELHYLTLSVIVATKSKRKVFV